LSKKSLLILDTMNGKAPLETRRLPPRTTTYLQFRLSMVTRLLTVITKNRVCVHNVCSSDLVNNNARFEYML